MIKKKKPGKPIYGIIGMGRFGMALAEELHSYGADFVVLDMDEEKISIARELTDNAYIVNNLEKKTLMEAGIDHCDVVINCIGEHIDTPILTTLNLVSMNIPRVIAKATSAQHGEILKKLGGEVVYPERDMAVRLANRLETANNLDFIKLSEKLNISKNVIPNKAIGKSVVDVNFRSHFGLNIIAIENNGNILEIVNPDYVFQQDDILYMAGSKDNFRKFADWADS